MIDPGIEGKVAVVTGINNPRGIGAAVCRALAAQGVRVFGTYFPSDAAPHLPEQAERGVPGEALYRWLQAQDASAVVESIRRIGGTIDAIEVDLGDVTSAAMVLARAQEAFGPVEILVNNAAYSVPDSLLPDAVTDGGPSAGGIAIQAFDVTGHDAHFAVNVRAPTLLIRDMARRHIARGGSWGRIVSISTDGASGFATEVSYGASKHALESVSRAAAAELGPYGITSNVVSLGPIQTGYIPPAAERAIISDTPLRRVGEPNDAADGVLFLVSEQARWITGQLIYVGGGHAM